MIRPITRDNLGAWLLRCNPTSEPELPQLIAEGGHRIHRWCVADNYRSRLMETGDPVVFWVSGNGRRLARGIWGVGQILAVHGTRSAGTGDAARCQTPVSPSADVDIPLFVKAISDQDLRVAGITDLEVQVQPQGSNPSWISKEQCARLSLIMPSSADLTNRSGRDRAVDRAVRE